MDSPAEEGPSLQACCPCDGIREENVCLPLKEPTYPRWAPADAVSSGEREGEVGLSFPGPLAALSGFLGDSYMGLSLAVPRNPSS